MAIGEAGSAVNKPDEGVSSHESKLRGTAAGVLKILEPSPAALSSQIVVAAALSAEAAAFFPSLRCPSLPSTDEGVIVSNGDG